MQASATGGLGTRSERSGEGKERRATVRLGARSEHSGEGEERRARGRPRAQVPIAGTYSRYWAGAVLSPEDPKWRVRLRQPRGE